MFKMIFIYFLLVHILGDYYFQTERLAEEKNQSFHKQIVHGLIYAVINFIMIIPVFNIGFFLAALFLSAGHLLIDYAKYYYIRQKYKRPFPTEIQRSIYILDQLLHILCIFIAAYILTLHNIDFSVSHGSINFFSIIGISPLSLISWITILLLIWKPSNITIKQLLCLYKPRESEITKVEEGLKDVEENSKTTGGFIGFLERLMILILLSISQYSAIGLVLTAKSIARYNKITESKEFAEYYLLGTLLSTVIVIGAYRLIF